MEPLRILPLGVQTFKNMRENNYVYVDKTQHVHRLVTHQKVYFLSRPRRFGKSLLLSTLKELYEGNRALFKGLWIEDKWNWSKIHPVIYLSFANIGFKELGLKKAILYRLSELAAHYNITLQTDSLDLQFKEIIEHVHREHGKVVILVDEYDKPIIEYLEKGTMDEAKQNQSILKTFYSVLKDAENSIEFLFITGVSKFAKVSIFSDLNHLTDITLNKNYATITGYTQEELESNFEEYIQLAIQELELGRETLLAEMKKWYDGYSWDGKNFLYNPFGTLNFLDNRAFRNYWYATGTPTFLVKLMRQQESFEFENQQVTDSFIDKCDLDNLDIVSVMFQTGYLTVKKLDIMTGVMVLNYPNQEVRDSTYQFVINDLTGTPRGMTSHITVKDLSQAFIKNDLDRVKLIINTLFSDVPVQLYNADKNDKKRELALSERFFHSIIHLLFKYLGVFIESEVSTSFGRADSIVQTATHVYIFEFKYNRSGKGAMTQLLKNNYADKYRASGKILIGLGVNFSHDTRQIHGWVAKNLSLTPPQ